LGVEGGFFKESNHVEVQGKEERLLLTLTVNKLDVTVFTRFS
jgi:hypothetical protein